MVAMQLGPMINEVDDLGCLSGILVISTRDRVWAARVPRGALRRSWWSGARARGYIRNCT